MHINQPAKQSITSWWDHSLLSLCNDAVCLYYRRERIYILADQPGKNALFIKVDILNLLDFSRQGMRRIFSDEHKLHPPVHDVDKIVDRIVDKLAAAFELMSWPKGRREFHKSYREELKSLPYTSCR